MLLFHTSIYGVLTKMRAYFFGNMYLSSIQQGLQSAHVVGNLFVKYKQDCMARDILFDWATDHKTIILLNAGYSEEIRNLINFFGSRENKYPWAAFNEGIDALDGATTCVGIIVPENIYEASKVLSSRPKDFVFYQHDVWGSHKPTGFEVELATRLNTYGLAR
jgi:hypothetical protein